MRYLNKYNRKQNKISYRINAQKKFYLYKKKKNTRYLFFLSIVIFCISVPQFCFFFSEFNGKNNYETNIRERKPSTQNGNNYSLEYENDFLLLNVGIKNDYPFIIFQYKNLSTFNYNITFSHIFEVQDLNQNGNFDPTIDLIVDNSTLQMNQLNWTLHSVFDEEFNNLDVNITGDYENQTIQYTFQFTDSSDFNFNYSISGYESKKNESNILFVYGIKFDIIGKDTYIDILSNEINFGPNGLLIIHPLFTSEGDEITVHTNFQTFNNESILYFSIPLFNNSIIYNFSIEFTPIDIFHPPPPPPFSISDPILWKILIITFVIISGIFGLALTQENFRKFLLNKKAEFIVTHQKLTMEDVLKNENRNMIIDEILKEPGIHFTELLRRIHIASGNLIWHLDVLEDYQIIRKERIGNYLTFYPYYLKNPISHVNLLVQKSETTVKILNFIQKHPGFNQTEISNAMKIDRGTLRYHLNKLLSAEVIHILKKRKAKHYFLK